MGWDEAWAAAAASGGRSPVYLLETDVLLGQGPSVGWSSTAWPGYSPRLIADQCTINWGRTSVPECGAAVSSASFVLRSDADVDGLQQGMVVRLSIVLGSVTQQVYVGVLRNYSREIGGPIVLDVVGFEGALWSRMVLAGFASGRFPFPEAGEQYAVALNYTAGDSSIQLAAGATLNKGASGLYAIKVEPSGGGTPFYLAGTSWSAPTLSGSLGTVLDSTDADAPAGSVVTVIAYDEGHPISLLTHAVDIGDTLSWPDSWRMYAPGSVYDRAEANAQLASSGLTTVEQEAWKLVVQARPETYAEVFGALLADSGIVLTQYQGAMAPRIMPDPEGIYTGWIPLIRQSDIVTASVTAWGGGPQYAASQVYDRTAREPWPIGGEDDVTTPYGALVYAHLIAGLQPPPPPTVAGASVSSSSGGAAPVLAGQPVRSVREVRLPIYGSISARSAARQDVLDRMGPYAYRRPEYGTVTLRGWHPYGIGDAIALDIPGLPSRGAGPGGITTGAACVIIGGGPDFFGASTTYELVCIPSNTDT